MKIILLLLLLCPSLSQADGWSKADTQRQLVFTAVLAADWAQTRYTSSHPYDFVEANPLLGAHPTMGRVDGYFASVLILHPIIAYLLPRSVRGGFQYVSIGIEADVVYHNWRFGVGMQF